MTQIDLIEELSANAWPTDVVQVVDGWRLRYALSVSRRLNSVWPNLNQGKIDLEHKLEIVEDFYSRRGSRTRYQMCPAAQPGELEKTLLARSYTFDAHTAVLTSSLKKVLDLTQPNSKFTIGINPSLTKTWFNLYTRCTHYDESSIATHHHLFRKIGPQTGFAFLKIKGKPAAIGLGVIERGWVGVFCMQTLPDFRRQGAANAVLHALASWGMKYSANQGYLQVMEDNPPALALYARTGFKKLYQYSYAEGPVDYPPTNKI